MNPSVLIVLCLIVPAAVVLWMFTHARRVIAILFTAVAFLLVIGVSAWQESLASLTTSIDSLAALLAIDVTSLLILGVHIHSARKHRGPGAPHLDHFHDVWTHAVAWVAGTAIALTLGDGVSLLRALRHAPAGTTSALSQAVTQINSGHAASAQPQGQGMVVLVIALVIFVALVFGAHRHKGGKRKKRPAGKVPAAIGGGGPGAAPARRGG